MGVEITKNVIRMTRGDTLIAPVTIIVNKEPYTPQAGDQVRFAMKHPAMTKGEKQYVDQEPLLIKNISTDNMLLRINPEDTKPFDFGEYVYDLQITFADGRVATFVENQKLILKPEVD